MQMAPTNHKPLFKFKKPNKITLAKEHGIIVSVLVPAVRKQSEELNLLSKPIGVKVVFLNLAVGSTDICCANTLTSHFVLETVS